MNPVALSELPDKTADLIGNGHEAIHDATQLLVNRQTGLAAYDSPDMRHRDWRLGRSAGLNDDLVGLEPQAAGHVRRRHAGRVQPEVSVLVDLHNERLRPADPWVPLDRRR